MGQWTKTRACPGVCLLWSGEGVCWHSNELPVCFDLIRLANGQRDGRARAPASWEDSLARRLSTRAGCRREQTSTARWLTSIWRQRVAKDRMHAGIPKANQYSTTTRLQSGTSAAVEACWRGSSAASQWHMSPYTHDRVP